MDNTTKISLTIELEGSTLVRKSKPEVIKYAVTAKDSDPYRKYKGKDGLKVVRKGVQKHYSLEAKPASQHINMTKEAYDDMISNECPYWAKPKAWSSMSKKERLEAHLQRTCEHFNGTSYSYEILND